MLGGESLGGRNVRFASQWDSLSFRRVFPKRALSLFPHQPSPSRELQTAKGAPPSQMILKVQYVDIYEILDLYVASTATLSQHMGILIHHEGGERLAMASAPGEA